MLSSARLPVVAFSPSSVLAAASIAVVLLASAPMASLAAPASPLVSMNTMDLARLLEAADEQEMMEVALAANPDSDMAERILVRIWRNIKEQERLLVQMGTTGHRGNELRMTKRGGGRD